MKHDTSGKVPILLVPQPSDDPNDPLNLPRWRRDLIVFILSLFAVIATTLSPILACDSLVLAFQYELTFTKIALLTGWHLLAVGVSGIFFVPFATVFGKRHLYLLGACLTCASCAWAGSVTDSYAGYKSLIGARVLQGVGLAPFEALVNVSVGDLFYVHERGSRMALSNLALFGGAFFTPVIAGVITDSLGWRWTFKFVAIFSGALIPFVFFFVPETAFRREALPEATGFETAYSMPTTETQAKDGSRTIAASAYEPKYPAPAIIPAKKTFAQTLSPFDGRKTDDNLLKLIFRPFPLFLQPGILWACLIQGTLIGWTVMIGIVLAAIFLGPPLYFTELQVGYMYAGPFVGALVGFAICGLIANPSVKWLTRWNNGVYEPEFRMVLVIPQLILGGIGLYGFGYTASNQFEYGWAGPTVLFGFEVAGMVCGAVASALYIADAHRMFFFAVGVWICFADVWPS